MKIHKYLYIGIVYSLIIDLNLYPILSICDTYINHGLKWSIIHLITMLVLIVLLNSFVPMIIITFVKIIIKLSTKVMNDHKDNSEESTIDDLDYKRDMKILDKKYNNISQE